MVRVPEGTRAGDTHVLLGSGATNAAGESTFDRRTEDLEGLPRNEVVQSRSHGESRVLLDSHRLYRGNTRNIHATHQCGSATGHEVDRGIVAIIQAPVTHQSGRVGGQGRIGLGNEFRRGHGPIPNADLIDHAVETAVRPIALADVAELTTDRSRTVHGHRADQATIKVQERSPTAMHRRHVSPSVQRQCFIGSQGVTHTSSDDPQLRPATSTLGQCKVDIVHARSVAEVEDTTPTLEAPRIHPAFNGEVRITKQGVVAHVDVVHIPLEGHTQ